MSVLNADHLLDQADRLIDAAGAGRPRQVDLRRGISSAYYAAFHTVTTAAADEFVGKVHQARPEYGLVLRSIDHMVIRRMCGELGGARVAPRYADYLPGGPGPELRAFMEAFPELQQQRHRADYDNIVWYSTVAAQGLVAFARAAIAAFWAAPPAQRKMFLYLVLFPLRR